MKSRLRIQAGFSLLELLTVIAIIGIFVLFVIPNMVEFAKSNQIRTSVRGFTADVRQARQLAVSRNAQARLTFSTGATANNYAMFTSTDGGTTWTKFGPTKTLEQIVHFQSTDFVDSTSDGRPDIIFLPNGTVSPMPANGRVVLQTNQSIPHPSVTVRLSAAGSVTSR